MHIKNLCFDEKQHNKNYEAKHSKMVAASFKRDWVVVTNANELKFIMIQSATKLNKFVLGPPKCINLLAWYEIISVVESSPKMCLKKRKEHKKIKYWEDAHLLWPEFNW